MTLAIVLMSVLPTAAQDTTDIRGKRALFLVYDGSWITEAGFKYRFSNSFALYGIVGFSISESDPQTVWGSKGKRTQVGFGVGAQFTVIGNSEASLYLTCAARYSSDEERSTMPSYNGDPEVHEFSSRWYALDFGPGVELWISRWLSISGQHLLRVSSRSFINTFSSSSGEQRGRDTYLAWGEETIVVSFFF